MIAELYPYSNNFILFIKWLMRFMHFQCTLGGIQPNFTRFDLGYKKPISPKPLEEKWNPLQPVFLLVFWVGGKSSCCKSKPLLRGVWLYAQYVQYHIGHSTSRRDSGYIFEPIQVDRWNLNNIHAQQNGKPSSSSQQSAIPQVSVPIINGNSRFETHCTWCRKEFLYQPVDPEIMTEAREFMCRKCKQKICGVFERSL